MTHQHPTALHAAPRPVAVEAPVRAPNVAALLVTWNRKEMVAQVLEDLSRQTFPIDRLDVVVCDNASTDGTAEHLRERFRPEREVDNPTDAAHKPAFRAPDSVGGPNTLGFRSLTIIRNTANLGGCGGFNTDLAFVERVLDDAGASSRPDYVWLVDDDVRMPAETCERLVRTAESDESIGLVGTRTVHIERPAETIETTIYFNPETGLMDDHPARGHRLEGSHREWVSRVGGPKGEREFEGLREVDVVSACSMLARWSGVRKVGLWDWRYFIYCDDADWCMRFAKAGYRVVLNLDATVLHTPWHYKLTPARLYYAQRNVVWMMEKVLPPAELRRVVARRLYTLMRDSASALVMRRGFHAEIMRRTVDDICLGRAGKLSFDGPAEQGIGPAAERAGLLRPGARLAFLCRDGRSIGWAGQVRSEIRQFAAERGLTPPDFTEIVRNDAPGAEATPEGVERIVYSRRWRRAPPAALPVEAEARCGRGVRPDQRLPARVRRMEPAHRPQGAPPMPDGTRLAGHEGQVPLGLVADRPPRRGVRAPPQTLPLDGEVRRLSGRREDGMTRRTQAIATPTPEGWMRTDHPLRIAILGWARLSAQAREGSGYNLNASELATGLSLSGHHVFYLRSGMHYSLLRRGPTVRRTETWRGIECFSLLNSRNLSPASSNFLNVRQEATSPADTRAVLTWLRGVGAEVVHIHSLEGYALDTVGAIRDAGLPVVVTPHNYHYACPQVDLLHKEKECCLDYEGGERCVGCLEAPEPGRARRRRATMQDIERVVGAELTIALRRALALAAARLAGKPPATARREEDLVEPDPEAARGFQAGGSTHPGTFDHGLTVLERDKIDSLGRAPADANERFLASRDLHLRVVNHYGARRENGVAALNRANLVTPPSAFMCRAYEAMGVAGARDCATSGSASPTSTRSTGGRSDRPTTTSGPGTPTPPADRSVSPSGGRHEITRASACWPGRSPDSPARTASGASSSCTPAAATGATGRCSAPIPRSASSADTTPSNCSPAAGNTTSRCSRISGSRTPPWSCSSISTPASSSSPRASAGRSIGSASPDRRRARRTAGWATASCSPGETSRPSPTRSPASCAARLSCQAHARCTR
ncbi:MAG: glycosyltransferase [Phycisphaerales bacterium]|nr:glycosyltransferase [Phycisphaerales bacterium]